MGSMYGIDANIGGILMVNVVYHIWHTWILRVMKEKIEKSKTCQWQFTSISGIPEFVGSGRHRRKGYFERTVTESRSSEDLQKVKGDWIS